MDLVLRALVIFAFIYLLTRVVGRRELGSAEPFDIILLVVVGDLVQQGVTQSDYSLTGAVLVISTFTLLTVFVSYLSVKVPLLRPVLDGDPLILVENGKPNTANLKRQRLDLGEVLAEARLQQVTRLEDIQWAILESSGQISIIPACDLKRGEGVVVHAPRHVGDRRERELRLGRGRAAGEAIAPRSCATLPARRE